MIIVRQKEINIRIIILCLLYLMCFNYFVIVLMGFGHKIFPHNIIIICWCFNCIVSFKNVVFENHLMFLLHPLAIKNSVCFYAGSVLMISICHYDMYTMTYTFKRAIKRCILGAILCSMNSVRSKSISPQELV